jgi:hypothetical protein
MNIWSLPLAEITRATVCPLGVPAQACNVTGDADTPEDSSYQTIIRAKSNRFDGMPDKAHATRTIRTGAILDCLRSLGTPHELLRLRHHSQIGL